MQKMSLELLSAEKIVKSTDHSCHHCRRNVIRSFPVSRRSCGASLWLSDGRVTSGLSLSSSEPSSEAASTSFSFIMLRQEAESSR